jgi:hypothetical protein
MLLITLSIAAMSMFLTAAMMPMPKMKPQPPVLRIVPEPPSPWEPGCSAFWLDPDLWERTPEVDGRLDRCWMYLDGPVLRERFNNIENLSGATMMWGRSKVEGVVTHFYTDKHGLRRREFR